MIRNNKYLEKVISSRLLSPLVLLFYSLLSYGVFIPFLGLYSDDWIFLSIYQKYGHAGLTQYFSTNRPVWGLLYHATLPVIGNSVAMWHVFSLLAMLMCGMAFRKLILLLWPDRHLNALIGGLLFILFPGYTLSPIAITFGHIYIVYLFFLLSTIFLIKAASDDKNRLLNICLSLIFYATNLLMMEYFFVLSFIQPIILWIIFSKNSPSLKQKLTLLAKFYWPWVIVLITVSIWRVFLFDYQTYNYSLNTLEIIKGNPFQGILILVSNYFSDLFKTGVYAWVEPIKYIITHKDQTTLYYATLGLVMLSFIVTYVIFLIFSKNNKDFRTESLFNGKGLLLAFFALSLAGWPFWVTGLDVSLNGLSSRFVLPFIFGSCIFFISIFEYINNSKLKISIVSIIIALALGKNLMVKYEFRHEQIMLSSYMNQLHERIPDLEAGAFIISNDLPFKYMSDATLSSIIDWFYAPQSDQETLDHVLVFSKDHQEALALHEFKFENVNFHFSGNLSKSVSSVSLFDYGVAPYGFNTCFTVLDQSNIDYYLPAIPTYSANVAKYSSTGNISEIRNTETDQLFNRFFPNKNTDPWCLNFQVLSKLQNNGKHQEIVNNYDLLLRPSFALEYLPYLNAFTLEKNWTVVTEILDSASKKSPSFVCSFLRNTEQQYRLTEEDSHIIDGLNERYQCNN